MLLSPSDHEKIKAAIAEAEARTSGEVFGVVTRESSEYWEVPLAWAGGVALIVPAAALLLGLHPQIIGLVAGGWTAGHTAAVEAAVAQALTAYLTLQAGLFVLVALLVSIPAVRRVLTPGPLKRERVRRRAQEQFGALGGRLTEGRTGVLIFASLAEHRVEVIADEGIASKVAPEAWAGVVKALTDGMKARDPGAGFAAAIRVAGDLLAQHAPRGPNDRNELPDTVVELDL